jgi:hypothetical protein
MAKEDNVDIDKLFCFSTPFFLVEGAKVHCIDTAEILKSQWPSTGTV